jgi:hypothetical protein
VAWAEVEAGAAQAVAVAGAGLGLRQGLPVVGGMVTEPGGQHC